jgi:hypothetical protein
MTTTTRPTILAAWPVLTYFEARASTPSPSSDLASKDTETRIQAARALGEKGTEREVPCLVLALAVDPLIEALPSVQGSRSVAWVLGEIGDKRAIRPLLNELPAIEGAITTHYFTFPPPEQDPKLTYTAGHGQDWKQIQKDESVIASDTRFITYRVLEFEPDVPAEIRRVRNPRVSCDVPDDKAEVSVTTDGRVVIERASFTVVVSRGRDGFPRVGYRYSIGAEARSKITHQDLGVKRFDKETWLEWGTSRVL